jgi:hypothetical protein
LEIVGEEPDPDADHQEHDDLRHDAQDTNITPRPNRGVMFADWGAGHLGGWVGPGTDLGPPRGS